MTWEFLAINRETGKKKLMLPGSASFVDQDVDLTSATSSILITTKTIDETTVIDVFVRGTLMRPGLDKDYTINVATNSIDFNTSLDPATWVKIRVY